MVTMVRIGGFLRIGRTVHDLRQFGRARSDPVLLDSAHEPVWLCLVLRPIGHHTAAHALLLRREHEWPPCVRRHLRPAPPRASPTGSKTQVGVLLAESLAEVPDAKVFS